MAAYSPEAEYNATAANIELQRGTEEGSFDEQGSNLVANTNYQEGELTRQEPGVKRTEENSANAHGLLTSGINERRKGDIAAGFMAKRTGVQLQRTQGEGRIKRGREEGQRKRESALSAAAQTRVREEDRVAKETAAANAAAAAAQPAAPAGGVVPRTTPEGVRIGGAAPAGAGGVVPRTYAGLPGGRGFVRIGGRK